MKYRILTAVMLCGIVCAAGTPVDVRGDFAGSKIGSRTPEKWFFNTNINPVGTGKVVQTGDKRGVRITSPGKTVAYFSFPKPVKAGEVYSVSCHVTGTGQAGLAIYFYTAKAWVGAVSGPLAALRQGPEQLQWSVTVPAELNQKKPAYASFVFHMIGSGDAVFTDFLVSRMDCK